MDFALVPDAGPPRIIRFVHPAQMPSDSTLALLDRSNNVLMVNNHLYDHLDASVQHQLLRTHAATHEFA